MILIDGKFTENDQLDPAKHKFIGMFRHPYPGLRPAGICCLICRTVLSHYSGDPGAKCWQDGHFDVPQYQTIGEGKT